MTPDFRVPAGENREDGRQSGEEEEDAEEPNETARGEQDQNEGSSGNSNVPRTGADPVRGNFSIDSNKTQALEESVETMREDLRKNKEEIQQQKGTERDLQEKLEYLENNSRRNNLRILNVPEGVQGLDLKKYIVSLIKKVIPLDETEAQIINDIQRVHSDPFRRNLNIKKPWRILVNFQTYSLKEKIIGKALDRGSSETGEIKFEIRSDLSRLTLNRQWELGKRLEEFKNLGAVARLKSPANLRVMFNNKMFNIRDPAAADDLIETIRKGKMV
ncbi:hypothetical protein NDU88_001659 [Pleurodeles waltl]|uniref:L1 transposable element RRM domain-containing protein n=1 Tax=Pleurodeles waltl TaxID=8319 RepID=A0AAV7S9D8_PLEWA|nr:hypothetical protein NDU88_001659 [Pleurodeles waltl]